MRLFSSTFSMSNMALVESFTLFLDVKINNRYHLGDCLQCEHHVIRKPSEKVDVTRMSTQSDLVVNCSDSVV